MTKRFTKALKDYNGRAQSTREAIKELNEKKSLTIFCHLTKRDITLSMTTEDAEMALNMLYSDAGKDENNPMRPVINNADAWGQTAEQKRFLMSFLPTDAETLDSLNNFSKAWMFGRNENGTKKNKTQSV
tara:strand:+ start:774 stop:1163 length:390 start_codon:yes stop_codon:yes gene_type:complete